MNTPPVDAANRDHSVRTQNILLSEAIEFLAYEINPDLWNTSGAARLANLQWFWGNPTLPPKKSRSPAGQPKRPFRPNSSFRVIS